jgi:hypothetical protein
MGAETQKSGHSANPAKTASQVIDFIRPKRPAKRFERVNQVTWKANGDPACVIYLGDDQWMARRNDQCCNPTTLAKAKSDAVAMIRTRVGDYTVERVTVSRKRGHKSTIDGSTLQLHQLDALTEIRKPAAEEQLRQPQPTPIGLKVRLCLEDEVPAIGCGWRVVTCQFRGSKVALLHAGYSATIKRADFKQILVGTRRARAMAVDGVGRTTGGTHG